MDNTNNPDKKRDDLCATVADMSGYKSDFIRKVRNGDRENEKVLTALIELEVGWNKLVEEVSRVVDFQRPAKRNTKKLGDLK